MKRFRDDFRAVSFYVASRHCPSCQRGQKAATQGLGYAERARVPNGEAEGRMDVVPRGSSSMDSDDG